jgi:N-acetylneuraminic acid mutarotase
MNYNNFNSLYLCLTFMFGYILFGVEPFVPAGRLGHSSILVGNKIYFIGGVSNTYQILNEVFYLDLSQSFNVANPPWTQVPNSPPFGSVLATVALDNSNNADLYLFGGMVERRMDVKTQNVSFIYKSNVNNLKWIVPNVSGAVLAKNDEGRAGIGAVSDNLGKFYIFGGLNISSATNLIYNVLSDMVTFDIASSSFAITNTVVKGRALYTATLLPSGVIAYIGGIEPFNGTFAIMSDISQIYQYDTNSSTWSIMVRMNVNFFFFA